MNPFTNLGAKIFAGTSAFLLLALIVLKLTTGAQIHELQDSINHPVTGWSARLTKATSDLAQCHANTATLEAGVERQNAAIQAQAAAGAARVAELDHVASQARSDAQSAQSRAAAILARPRTGNSCADADAAILEAIH